VILSHSQWNSISFGAQTKVNLTPVLVSLSSSSRYCTSVGGTAYLHVWKFPLKQVLQLMLGECVMVIHQNCVLIDVYDALQVLLPHRQLSTFTLNFLEIKDL
jgi:hypothetical protein